MLRLELRPSRTLAILFAFMHCAALGLLLMLGMPWWGNLLAALALAVSAIHAIALHAWQARPGSIAALEIADDCKVAVLDRAGDWHDADLLSSSFVSPYLTVLNLRYVGARRSRSAIIVPDRVQADPYRRLRVLLRWRCSGNALEEKTVV